MSYKLTNTLCAYKIPILYSGGSVFKALAQLISGFIIARYVAPEDLGLWTTINLALTYSTFLQAGLVNGLNRELPFAYGKGQESEAFLMAGTGQTLTLISSLIVILSGLVYLSISNIPNQKTKFGIISVILIIVFTFYQNYLMSTFRSKNSFLNLSIIQFIEASTNLISLLLVVRFAYYGLIQKAVIVIIIYVILLHIYRPIKVGIIWDKIILIKLLKTGLPIFGLAYIENIALTFDKIWLLKYSNLTDIGLYSFAFYGLTGFSILSTSIASYIYPRMTYNYGKNNNKKDLWKYSKKITILLISIQFPLALIGYTSIPFIIKTYFTNYDLSIHTMQLLLVAGAFKGSVISVNVLWSLKEWKLMTLYQLVYSFLIIAATYIGINNNINKIEGIAYGILIANAINLFIGMTFTYKATNS